jgi:pimeloyl-ACP methyl ester carboxylesterase
MGKALTWFVIILLAIGAVAYGARAYATRVMSQRALVPKTLGSATPDSVGVPFTRIPIESGDRTLIAWWVQAPADSGKTAPALLFLHGNRSSISDYPSLQRFFYRQGISSLIFDYSGFGASGGTASLRSAVEDAGRVARVFADTAGAAARKVAMGSALGATVLLQAIDSVQPHVDGIVIESVDASVRDAAVRTGRLPSFLAPAMVDIGDNVTAASRVTVPALVVHSVADSRVPIAEAESVVATIPGRVSLVRHGRRGHSAILTSSRPCDWAAVLAFVQSGILPAERVDTVDACTAPTQPVVSADTAPASAGTTTGATTKTKAPSSTETKAPASKTKAGTKRP